MRVRSRHALTHFRETLVECAAVSRETSGSQFNTGPEAEGANPPGIAQAKGPQTELLWRAFAAKRSTDGAGMRLRIPNSQVTGQRGG